MSHTCVKGERSWPEGWAVLAANGVSDRALLEYDPLVTRPPHSEIHRKEDRSYRPVGPSLQGGAGRGCAGEGEGGGKQAETTECGAGSETRPRLPGSGGHFLIPLQGGHSLIPDLPCDQVQTPVPAGPQSPHSYTNW